MEVGDLIMVINTLTTGIDDGTIGLLIKKEIVNKKDILYWAFIGSYGREIPFWGSEIEKYEGKQC